MSYDKKVRVNVHLDPDIIARLDEVTAEIKKTESWYNKTSRADVVRFAICKVFMPEKQYLENQEKIQAYLDKQGKPKKK